MQPRGGNTYMCQPSDLGSIINAKVKVIYANNLVIRSKFYALGWSIYWTDKNWRHAETINWWSAL